MQEKSGGQPTTEFTPEEFEGRKRAWWRGFHFGVVTGIAISTVWILLVRLFFFLVANI